MSRGLFVGRVSWSVRGSWSSGVVFRGCARLRGPLGGNSKAVVFCSCLAAIFAVCSLLLPLFLHFFVHHLLGDSGDCLPSFLRQS